MNKNKGIKDKKKLDKERDTNNIQKDKIEKKGIYIHIPFCKQKCGYCDFHSFAKIEDLKDEDKYIDTIFFRRSERQVC